MPQIRLLAQSILRTAMMRLGMKWALLTLAAGLALFDTPILLALFHKNQSEIYRCMGRMALRQQ